MASSSDDDQIKDKGVRGDGSQMFDDLRRPEGDERQSLIEKDKDGKEIDTRAILQDEASV